MEDTQGQYGADENGVDNTSDSDYEPTDNPPFVADSAVPPTESRKSTPLNPLQTQSAVASSLPKSDRKAVSTGFLVDEDDDQSDAAPQGEAGPGNETTAVLASSQRSNVQSPTANMPANVPLQVSGEEGNSSAPSEPVPVSSLNDSTGGVSSQNGVSTTVSQSLPLQHGRGPSVSGQATPKARLPHDVVGMLEDRIKEDPRGDMDAWLSLTAELRRRNKFDDARKVYSRFFKIFPSSAEQWVTYANMELENNELYHVEQIFHKALLNVPNVQLWSLYLDYIRRRNNLTTDVDGSARRIINQAYDFALQQIGIDKDSGPIWQDYVHFIRSAPGSVSGTGWQDQQKVDSLRKIYQRAICVPTEAVSTLWKEYDVFEMGINKMTGRKFLQEKSPAYMTARSSFVELQNITKDLVRSTLPRLPPLPGCEGDDEFTKQLEIWNRWIQWEKGDPLVLRDEDKKAYQDRILYVYKQALMAMRFWSTLWFEAAEFCFESGLDNEGLELLRQGTDANPESCLLAFKHADRIESTTSNEGDAEGIKSRAAAVRAPYDKVLDALYDLIARSKVREAQDISRIETTAAESVSKSPVIQADDGDMDENKGNDADRNAQVEAVKTSNASHVQLLSKTISFVWVALMRATRRIAGKGNVADMPGSRQIFADARKRGRLTSDVYVASALIEHHCYKDASATKIFERGMKLFPEDESFALEFLRFLVANNDITNARVVFEQTVSKLTSKPETVPRAKPVFAYIHEYESRYGELSQVRKLEKRMADLFPEDPTLNLFVHRFSVSGFDPTATRPLISRSQSKLKPVVPTVESVPSPSVSPVTRILEAVNSPKRPFVPEEEDESLRPRKVARGESPLKGAAGRRLDAQRRLANGGMAGQGHPTSHAMIPPLPGAVTMLLSLIPNAKFYNVERFSAEKMVDLLRRIEIPHPSSRGPHLPPNPAMAPQMTTGGRFDSIPVVNPHSYVQSSYPPTYTPNPYVSPQPHGGGGGWNYR